MTSRDKTSILVEEIITTRGEHTRRWLLEVGMRETDFHWQSVKILSIEEGLSLSRFLGSWILDKSKTSGPIKCISLDNTTNDFPKQASHFIETISTNAQREVNVRMWILSAMDKVKRKLTNGKLEGDDLYRQHTDC